MDIRTLAILLGITNILQFIAVFIQYRMNRTYRGIGWWTVGFLCGAIGFWMLLARDSISNPLISIILTNFLLILATILQYIGVKRFFSKKENRWFIALLLLFFLTSCSYFTYIQPDTNARSVLFSLTLTVNSALIAFSFFKYKTRAVTASANFIAFIFLLQGCFFAYRSVDMLLVNPVNSIFTPTLSQTLTFLVSFIHGILFTFGLIIMVNQRLHRDSREANAQFAMIFNTGLDATLITRDRDGVIMNINEGFTRMTGYSRTDSVGKTDDDLNLWKNPSERVKVIDELREKGFCENFEAVFQRKDGSPVTAILTSRVVSLRGVAHVISMAHDITERKRLEDELRQQATLDDLTGVTNRRHFMELAQAELTRAARYQHPLAVALVDIDHFKRINDTFEHAGGDKVLLSFVNLCRTNIREIDVFARFGGDEFVLLLPETDQEQAYGLVERLRKEISAHSIELGGTPISISTSWGISSLNGGAESLDALLGRADRALYWAKEAGRDRVMLWNPSETGSLPVG